MWRSGAPSGSGKSVLLAQLAGLLPVQGRSRIDGLLLNTDRRSAARPHGVDESSGPCVCWFCGTQHRAGPRRVDGRSDRGSYSRQAALSGAGRKTWNESWGGRLWPVWRRSGATLALARLAASRTAAGR